MSWIDAHIHLDKYEAQHINQLIQNAQCEGIDHLVAVSVDLASSQYNEQLYKRYPALIYPCYGYHPEQPLPTEEEAEQLFSWIEQRALNNEHYAIGEVGLPYYQQQEALEKGEPFDLQPYLAYLKRWLTFAQKWDKPIALHVIYEHVELVLAMLEEIPLKAVHFHWYKGSEKATQEIVRRGYMVSITPDVVYEAYTQRLVSQIPLTQLMLETDGPWPFEHQFAGKLTTPSMIKRSCRAIAAILRMDEQQVREQLYANTKRFYQINN